MAEIRSKLLVFGLDGWDGFVLIDKDNNCLPFNKLTDYEESNYTTTDILAKELFSEITSINSNWPSLFFNLAHVNEYIKDQEYIIDIIYSVYLEGKISIVEGYEWKKISSLTQEFPDYDVVIEVGKKRYV